MKQWIDESGQEYGFDTHDMKLYADASFEFELPINSITKEQLAKIIGGEPIIRCKDCKYFEPRSIYGHGLCHIHCNGVGECEVMNETYYCNYAERKVEE